MVLMNADIENLRHRPEHAQHEQDAHERGQMGNGLEDGHEDQSTDTQEEDGLALSSREAVAILSRGHFLRGCQLALERE